MQDLLAQLAVEGTMAGTVLVQVRAIGVRSAGDIAPRLISGRDEGAILGDRLGPGAFDGLDVARAWRMRFGLVDLVVRVVSDVIAPPRAGPASIVDRVVPGVLLDGYGSGPQGLHGPGGGPLRRHHHPDVGFEVDRLDDSGRRTQNADRGRRRGRARPTGANGRLHDRWHQDGGQPDGGGEQSRCCESAHAWTVRGPGSTSQVPMITV